MLKTFYLFSVLLFALLISCKTKTDYTKNYNNSNLLAYSLIKKCVDTMKNINPSFNTRNYVLDLSSIDTLNKQGVDSFLQVKNEKLTTTPDDSIIVYENANYDAFHMKQSMIIKIRTLTYKNDRLVIVTASKIKSTNEIVDAIIELERHKNDYKIKNVKITN